MMLNVRTAHTHTQNQKLGQQQTDNRQTKPQVDTRCEHRTHTHTR